MTSTVLETETVQWRDALLKTVPKEVFNKSNEKAAMVMLRVAGSIALSLILLAYLPAYFLPITWFVAGTAFTGLFTIAHDCGHYSFFESRKLNDAIGTIAFLPLLYPMESWRLHHAVHHASAQDRTNVNYQQKPKKFQRFVNPVFWVYDLGLYFLRYFDLSQFSEQQQKNARLSVLSVYAYTAAFVTLMTYTMGIWSLIKFWVMPWLIFHFWKNNLRHYSLSHIYRYPDWVEFMCYKANYLLPHYLSTDIPVYNYVWAYKAIRNSEHGAAITEKNFLALLFDAEDIKKMKHVAKQVAAAFGPLVGQKDLAVSLFKRIHWMHVILLFGTPIASIYGAYLVPLQFKTLVWTVVFYYMTGLGITAGYHRLWAHRAYDASLPVRLVILAFGTGAFEGSVRWWCRDHRAHHRYTDTNRDPYSAQKGFIYSHIGWMLTKQDPANIGKADISDLNADACIRFQHRNYYWLAPLFSFVFPSLVAGFGWDDFLGGLVYTGLIRLVFVHHATFFVNSLAHTLGTASFDDKHTPRDSIITALLTLGEGYHNFHHEFPNDYRNGIRFYHYDPTKWLIRALAFFGLTYNLHVFPENEVQKGYAQMQQKKLDQIKGGLTWGPDVTSLPEWTTDDVQKALGEGISVIIIDGLVHDISSFIARHPGGSIIKPFIGKDASDAFNGEIYDHSNAARNLLTTFRVARFKDLNEQPVVADLHHD